VIVARDVAGRVYCLPMPRLVLLRLHMKPVTEGSAFGPTGNLNHRSVCDSFRRLTTASCFRTGAWAVRWSEPRMLLATSRNLPKTIKKKRRCLQRKDS
jgi:hypothetical protein